MSRFSRFLLCVLAVGIGERSRCFTLIPQSSIVYSYSYASCTLFKPLTTKTALVSVHKVGKARFSPSYCTSKDHLQDDNRIISTTEEWLKQWVIGLELCPWASSVWKNNGVRLIVVRGSSNSIDSHVAKVVDEANTLESVWNEKRGAWFPTTLMVFPDPSYLGEAGGEPSTLSCGAFPVRPRITHAFTGCMPPLRVLAVLQCTTCSRSSPSPNSSRATPPGHPDAPTQHTCCIDDFNQLDR
jgi:hypothetical protein